MRSETERGLEGAQREQQREQQWASEVTVKPCQYTYTVQKRGGVCTRVCLSMLRTVEKCAEVVTTM